MICMVIKWYKHSCWAVFSLFYENLCSFAFSCHSCTKSCSHSTCMYVFVFHARSPQFNILVCSTSFPHPSILIAFSYSCFQSKYSKKLELRWRISSCNINYFRIGALLSFCVCDSGLSAFGTWFYSFFK